MEKLSKQKTRLVQMNLDGAITDAELVELMRENRALLDAYAERLQALPEAEARAADIRAMVTELRPGAAGGAGRCVPRAGPAFRRALHRPHRGAARGRRRGDGDGIPEIRGQGRGADREK